jgi:hypothetical protein
MLKKIAEFNNMCVCILNYRVGISYLNRIIGINRENIAEQTSSIRYIFIFTSSYYTKTLLCTNMKYTYEHI